MKKRFLSSFLCLCMTLSLLSAPARAAEGELTPGETYWFDLSRVNIPGKQNTLPDPTCHWVPFTYAGSVNAYVLKSRSDTNTGAKGDSEKAAASTDPANPIGCAYEHALFISDYILTHTVSWDALNTQNLIFGRDYASGGADYTLRAPSTGSHEKLGDGGSPQNNEWEQIRGGYGDTDNGYIKNWSGMYSWGQDTYSNDGANRARRGNGEICEFHHYSSSRSYEGLGFRPVLEPKDSALRAVSVDLGEGTIGTATGVISIVVKAGESFTAPGVDGVTFPVEQPFCGWMGSDGKVYAAGAAVPAAVTGLSAKWDDPAPFAHTHNLSVGCETNSGEQVTFHPLPDMSTYNYSGYTLTGGSYYLPDAAAVGGPLTISGDVKLCLNGHTLSFKNGKDLPNNRLTAAVSVPQGSSLSVCDCGRPKGKIGLTTGGFYGWTTIGGAGNVTLYGCAVEINKTSSAAAYGLYNTGGVFTLCDSRISATHTTSGSNMTPFAIAVKGETGTTIIHGGSLSATVSNGTAYTDGRSGAEGLDLEYGSTAYLLGDPAISTSNDTNANNQCDVYVSSPSTQFWLSKEGESYGGASLTMEVSGYSYRNGGVVVRGVGEKGNAITIKDAPAGFVKTVVETQGRKDVVLTGPYKVKFNANGGAGTMYDQEFSGWTDSRALTANGFTGAGGASFRGWNTAADGSGTSYADGAAVSALAYGGTVDLYAQWGEAHTHTWATAWSKDTTHHWHECTAQGCGITENSSKNGYAAHTWNAGVVTTPPTASAEGVKTYTCTACTHTKTEVLPKLTFSVSGTVTDHEDNGLPSATVKLMQGKTEIATTQTDGQGNYSFEGVPAGLYNVVAGKDGVTKTILVELTNANAAGKNVQMPEGNKNSEVEVKNNTPAVVVGGVDVVAEAETVASGETVTVKLTVEKKDSPPDKTEIDRAAQDRTVELYLDLSLVKTVQTSGGGTTSTDITDTGDKVLEIVVPYDFTNKTDVMVYRKHGAENAAALTSLSSAPAAPADRTFYADSANGRVTIYAAKFSTYAIGYRAAAQPPTPPTHDDSSDDDDTYYTLTATAGQGGSISPSGKVSVQERRNKTFVITPDKGYAVADVLVDGKSVGAVTEYAFEKVLKNHTIEARFQKADSRPAWNPFVDVKAGDWFHDSVKVVYEQGLMEGTDSAHFSPNAATSRAMIATILWRQAGSPEPKAKLTYPDCVADSWYAKAVAWASEAGVVKGYASGGFGPDDPVTREQLAVMLWRYAGEPAAGGTLNAFSDRGKAGRWAVDGLRWAVEQGLLIGRGGGVLDPTGQATRAEAAAMLVRFRTL